MKIFVDTNIIMELLENRSQADVIDEILIVAEENGWQKYISIGSFYTLTYLVERLLRRSKISNPELVERQREILNDILASFYVVPLTASLLRQGVNDSRFLDLEDSYQYRTAVLADCDCILTINT